MAISDIRSAIIQLARCPKAGGLLRLSGVVCVLESSANSTFFAIYNALARSDMCYRVMWYHTVLNPKGYLPGSAEPDEVISRLVLPGVKMRCSLTPTNDTNLYG